MPMPRLVKVSCPQCGAGMRLDPTAQMVTCSFCGQSSFVQLANNPAPVPPNDGQNYGTIHVRRNAQAKAIAVIITLVVLAPVVLLGAMGAVVYFVAKPAKPAKPHATSISGAGKLDEPGPVCAQTVACCKIMLRATNAGSDSVRSCEAMRALSDAQCEKQLETFKTSAKSLGQTCE